MTPKDYQDNGYKVSLQTEQAVIDRVEDEVKTAYILPLVGEYNAQDADHRKALMCLTFIGLSQAQCFATRSGGKDKNANESITATFESINAECAHRANCLLSKLGNVAKCDDIYRIYFNTNFINL